MALRSADKDILNAYLFQTFGIPGVGKRIWLDPAKGSDGNSGETPEQAVKSITCAYAMCRSGYNDTVLWIPGATGTTLTAKLTWSKTYTHLLGMHPGRMNSRCRMSATAVTASMTPLVTLSGQGCMWKNVMVSAEGDHATYMASPLHITGARVTLDNVHTRNIGASAYVDNSHRSLTIGSAEDLTCMNCSFGETSYDAATATSAVIEFTGTDSGKYLFYNCQILGAGSANAVFVKGGANFGGYTLFKNCLFENRIISDMDAMTQGFSLSGTGNEPVFLDRCMIHGCTNLETSDSGLLFGDGAAAAATGGLVIALTG